MHLTMDALNYLLLWLILAVEADSKGNAKTYPAALIGKT
jgi:hypothetical protein